MGIQRINGRDDGSRRISSYLGKQTNLELIALGQFNGNLSPQKKLEKVNSPLPTRKMMHRNFARNCSY
jgi:hypothetical protein